MSVFDENTRYSLDINLFNRHVFGGAGLHKLVSFMHGEITVCIAFALRTGNETYELHLVNVDSRDPSLVQTMYQSFERICANHLEQWYFLHEEIPFVK
jgi:lauroyl/myristoyl acyltransferase